MDSRQAAKRKGEVIDMMTDKQRFAAMDKQMRKTIEKEARADERRKVQDSWKDLIKDEREGAAKEAYAKGLREGQRSKTAFGLGYHEGREDEREHSTYPEGWKDGRKDLIEKLTTAFGDGEISRRIRKEAPESASSETAAKAPSATTRVGSS